MQLSIGFNLQWKVLGMLLHQLMNYKFDSQSVLPFPMCWEEHMYTDFFISSTAVLCHCKLYAFFWVKTEPGH